MPIFYAVYSIFNWSPRALLVSPRHSSFFLFPLSPVFWICRRLTAFSFRSSFSLILALVLIHFHFVWPHLPFYFPFCLTFSSTFFLCLSLSFVVPICYFTHSLFDSKFGYSCSFAIVISSWCLISLYFTLSFFHIYLSIYTLSQIIIHI